MKKAKAKSAIETIKEAAWPRSPTMPASPFSTEHGTSPAIDLSHTVAVNTLTKGMFKGLKSADKKALKILITHFPPRIWYGTKSEHPVVFQEVCDVEECGSVGVEFGAVS